MKYNSLISAIPSKWKQCVKKSKISCHTSPADGEIIVKLRKGNKNVLSTQCKDYYKEFVNIKCVVFLTTETRNVTLTSLLNTLFQYPQVRKPQQTL